MKSIALFAALVLASTISLADVHPEVQAALDYSLPRNDCGDPIVIPGESNVTAPTQSSSGTGYFEGSSTASVSDLDGYERKRLLRKQKRHQKCVAKYKKILLKDMVSLKGSAKHGLTQDQANAILANIALAQKVYMTPNGLLEEDAPAPEGDLAADS